MPGTATGHASAVIAFESTPPTSAWQWPVDSRRVLRGVHAPTSRFGPGHRGVDLAAEPDAEVRAVAKGIVRFVGEIAGIPIVSVDHGPIRSTYQPVTPSVRVGEVVTAGTVLGSVSGPTGHCPVPCLHLGARVGAGYLDPLRMLNPRRAVLKPLRPAAVRHGDALG